MLDAKLLGSIATQMMSGSHVDSQGRSIPVRFTSTHHLRSVSFTMDGREYTAIEQNPEKPSQWGKLARSAHQVVQFKDNETNRFIAVSVDGQARKYSGYRERRE